MQAAGPRVDTLGYHCIARGGLKIKSEPIVVAGYNRRQGNHALTPKPGNKTQALRIRVRDKFVGKSADCGLAGGGAAFPEVGEAAGEDAATKRDYCVGAGDAPVHAAAL